MQADKVYMHLSYLHREMGGTKENVPFFQHLSEAD